MKVAIQIPIKARSSVRVPNKNFRDLNGKPFACWLLDRLYSHIPNEWDVFIDSEDESTWDFFKDRYGDKFKFFKRDKWFAGDQANGNHVMNNFVVHNMKYDIFAQVFVTAVTLEWEVIKEALDAFINQRDKHDSVFLVSEEVGWFWQNGKALNYQPTLPDGLPRSQDAVVLKETTGFYAITKEAALRTGCRVGANPIFHKVKAIHSLDVDTMEDFEEAKRLLSNSEYTDEN